jgi:hypothetical protein
MRGTRKLCAYVFGTLFATAVFFAGTAAARDLDGVELKLLFKPEIYTDRQTGFNLMWERFKKAAEAEGLQTSVDDKCNQDTVQRVRYPDTADNKLAAMHYNLRQRVTVKEGQPDTGDLTLKYRTELGQPIPEEEILKDTKFKPKFEGDKPGYMNGHVGESKTFASLSVTQKNTPVLQNNENLAFFAQYFPVMKTWGIPLDTPLTWPERREVIQHSTVLGYVEFGGEKIEIEACTWNNYASGKFVVGEMSWRYEFAKKDQVEAMEKVFNRMQQDCTDILMPGKTKVAVITE